MSTADALHAVLGKLSARQAETGGSRALATAFIDLSGPIDAETRRRMVADAAYYRAEARGFITGYELEDWQAAEAEIDRFLRQTGFQSPAH